MPSPAGTIGVGECDKMGFCSTSWMRFSKLGTVVEGLVAFVLESVPQVTGSAAIGPKSISHGRAAGSRPVADIVRDRHIAGESRAGRRVGECPVFGVCEADSAGSAIAPGRSRRCNSVCSRCPRRLPAGSGSSDRWLDCPSTSLTTTGLAATEERLSVTVTVAEVSLSLSVAKY